MQNNKKKVGGGWRDWENIYTTYHEEFLTTMEKECFQVVKENTTQYSWSHTSAQAGSQITNNRTGPWPASEKSGLESLSQMLCWKSRHHFHTPWPARDVSPVWGYPVVSLQYLLPWTPPPPFFHSHTLAVAKPCRDRCEPRTQMGDVSLCAQVCVYQWIHWIPPCCRGPTPPASLRTQCYPLDVPIPKGARLCTPFRPHCSHSDDFSMLHEKGGPVAPLFSIHHSICPITGIQQIFVK